MLANNHKTKAHYNSLNHNMVDGPFVFQRLKACVNRSQKRLDQWNQLQKKKYLAFIFYYQWVFQNKKSKQMWAIYNQMKKFIKVRNSNQCRIYHLTMIKKYGTLQDILLNNQKQVKNLPQILQFYRQQLSQLNIWQNKQKYIVKNDDNRQYTQFNITVKEKKQQQKYCENKKDNLDNIRTDLTFNQNIDINNNLSFQEGQYNRVNEYQHQINGFHINGYSGGRHKGGILSMPPISSVDYQYYDVYNYGYPFPCPQPMVKQRDNRNRDAQWRICHELFLAWTSKLKSLLQDE